VDTYRQVGDIIQVQKLIQIAFLLEEHIETAIAVHKYKSNSTPDNNYLDDILRYYSSTPLHHKQIKFTRHSLVEQIKTPVPYSIQRNKFFLLTSYEPDTMSPTTAEPRNSKPSQLPAQPPKFWVQDTILSTIVNFINAQLKHNENILLDTTPTDKQLGEEQTPQQHLRLNLVRHREAVGTLKTIELFKGFAAALQSVDPLLSILPYASSKQHYTPISSNKQIQSIDENRLLQFSQPYYKKQLFSLSGYFHIKSSLSYRSLLQSQQVEEWLDFHCYSLKLCPSQSEEMVPVGALCFSNLFMHREELKCSIMLHPLWQQEFPKDMPILDIYVSDFLTS
jgi:hypothetical protein